MNSDLKITNTHDRTRSSDSRICDAFHGARSKMFHKADTLTVVKAGRAWRFRWERNTKTCLYQPATAAISIITEYLVVVVAEPYK